MSDGSERHDPRECRRPRGRAAVDGGVHARTRAGAVQGTGAARDHARRRHRCVARRRRGAVDVRTGCYDVHERIRDMNANGVFASMNFSSWPGISGQYFATTDAEPEYVAAITRAYNDWHIDEWCRAYPGRFIPLGLSGFMLGAEWMAAEITRLASKGCHAI